MPGVRPIFLFILAALPAAMPASEIRVEIRDAKGVPVADAVASLTPLDDPVKATPPAEPVLIVQEGEEFRPHVTAVVAGTRVSFPNRDAVQHHVAFLLGKRYRTSVLLAMAGRPDDYAISLRTAGYYTGDAGSYARNVRLLAREYDGQMPPDPVPPSPPPQEPAAQAVTVPRATLASVEERARTPVGDSIGQSSGYTR